MIGVGESNEGWLGGGDRKRAEAKTEIEAQEDTRIVSALIHMKFETCRCVRSQVDRIERTRSVDVDTRKETSHKSDRQSASSVDVRQLKHRGESTRIEVCNLKGFDPTQQVRIPPTATSQRSDSLMDSGFDLLKRAA